MTFNASELLFDDVALDQLLALVRGADGLKRSDPDLGPARRKLRSVLKKVNRANAQNRTPGPDAEALKTTAKHAARLREAYDDLSLVYGQLDNASLAALFEAIRDDGAQPPAMLLDDETNLAIRNADTDDYEVTIRPAALPPRGEDEDEHSYQKRLRQRLNLPALAPLLDDLRRLERYALAAIPRAKKGRPPRAPREVVRLLAGFLDWCCSPNDPQHKGGGFQSSISIAGGDDGRFYEFVLAAFEAATGVDVSDANSFLLHAVRDVVAERRAEPSAGIAHTVPDERQEVFAVPPAFRDRNRS